METKTDWRQFRKSTHLASADLDAMETDGKKLIFTIKEVKYEEDVNVSGTKMAGIFCYFLEDIKPLKLNSTNNKILAGFAKKDGLVGKECHVKMMGAITDGVRIKPIQPVDAKKPQFTEANFEKAKEAKATIEGIRQRYELSKEIETKYLDYVGAKK